MSTSNLSSVTLCFDDTAAISAQQQSLQTEVIKIPEMLRMVNKLIEAYPGTIMTILPVGYSFINEFSLEKIVKKIISSNIGIKAVYSDVLMEYTNYSYVEYSQGFPATFFNPGKPFLESNFDSEIVSRIKQGNVVYYFPEVLYKCHKQ